MRDQRHAYPTIHYERSAMGLWVRAVRTPEAVQLEWQQRTARGPGGTIRTLDANGDVIAECPIQRHRWASTWASAGSIPLGDALVAWGGVPYFDACAYGIQRHAAALLAYGFGETPEEVATWFTDPARLEWAVEERYRIDRECPPLEGLIGTVCFFEMEGGKPRLMIHVADRIYPIPLDDSEAQRALLCAAILSPTVVDSIG